MAYRGLDGSCLLSDRPYLSRAISAARQPASEDEHGMTRCFKKHATIDPFLITGGLFDSNKKHMELLRFLVGVKNLIAPGITTELHLALRLHI